MNNKCVSKIYSFISEAGVTFLSTDLPLSVESTAYIKNAKTNILYARCIFSNLGEKKIRSIKCDFILKNDDDIVIHCENVEFDGLLTSRDHVFGQSQGIELGEYKDFNFAEIKVKEICFEDYSCETSDAQLIVLPEAQLLEDALADAGLVEQYQRETDSKHTFVPMQMEGHWQCACGALNNDSEATCHKCSSDKELVFAAYDKEALAEHLEAYLEEQARIEEELRLQREEEERIRQEEAAILAAKRKRITKMVTIIVSLAIIIGAAAYATIEYIIPMVRYDGAISNYENGQYKEAYETFAKLDDYKDSRAYCLKSQYNYAISQKDSGNFDEAITAFEKLDDYGDSKKLITETKYLKAKDCLDKKDYENAISYFEDVIKHKDSKKLITEAKYGYASSNLDRENEKTCKYLIELKKDKYKDSSDLYNDLFAWHAKIVINDSENDEKTAAKKISKYDKIYCHVKLTGGEIDGKTRLKYVARYPNGTTSSGKWDKVWKEGVTGKCVFWYDIPQYGRAGTFSVSIYTVDNNKLIGEGTVELTDR